MTAPGDDRARLEQAYRDMWSAMLDQDTDRLAGLLADGYTLTHMTGYRQDADEWITQVGNGQMRYHAAVQQSVSVEIDGDSAVVVGRSIVGATIWGSRGTWPLQLTTTYRRDDMGDWIAQSTVATTF